MIINRAWAMPNKWTFKIKPIKELVERYVGDGIGWADPFAGYNTYAEYRNDLDTSKDQPYHLESQDFMNLGVLKDLNGVIFDPPYSLGEVVKSYKSIGFNLKDDLTGGYVITRNIIATKVKSGGHVISFGWNTTGMAKKRSFEIVEILIVNHGGYKHDTLVTVERKL